MATAGGPSDPDAPADAAVTRSLDRAGAGEAQAAAELLPLVYEQLRALARSRMAAERPDQTLQATALIHEAFLRLVGADPGGKWNGRCHFFAAAAEAMRRILVERARRRRRLRHGGGRVRLDLDRLDSAQLSADDGAEPAEELLALDEALTRLAVEEPQAAELVELRYFAGLTIERTADVLGISVRTANRHWAFAKAWLFQQLSEAGDADATGR